MKENNYLCVMKQPQNIVDRIQYASAKELGGILEEYNRKAYQDNDWNPISVKASYSSILSTIDDVGACSYASVANEIFTSFEGDESKFEQNFGFPMYDKDTGKPNYSLLLADLYLNVNQQSNGGSLVKVDPNTGQITLNQEAFNTKIDPLGRRLLNAENQAYLSNSGGKNVIAINNYLKTRGANFTTQVVSGVDNHSQVSFRSLEPVINGGLDRGYNYSLGIYSRGDEIRLISVDGRGTVSTKTWGEGGGHSVYVTGISEQGIVVSSWGGKYVIPFEDLSQSNARWILTKDKVNVQ